MTDDICGYEDTTTDHPCQHPAGSCPVPSHSDPDADNPQGRPDSYTEDRAAEVLAAAESGLSKGGCARSAGVTRDTLNRWLDKNPAYEDREFRAAFARARARGERRLVTAPLKDDPDDPVDIDGQHARFLLSTSFDYVKTEKRELENTGDEPLSELVVDFTDVDT